MMDANDQETTPFLFPLQGQQSHPLQTASRSAPGLVDRKLRLRRLFDPKSGNSVVIALDHGATLGPIQGIEDMHHAVGQIVGQNVNGIVLHKGNIRVCRDLLATDAHLALIVHASASVTLSPHANEKVLVAGVEEALRLGADALSIHVNIGPASDHRMLADLGQIAGSCDAYGVPLLAMMYCRGEGIDSYSERNIAIAARVAMELGADVIKVNYSGSVSSFRTVLRGVSVPVIIAGGNLRPSLRALLEDVSDAMEAGASGVAIGRNAFQQGQPREVLAGLTRLIHDQASIDEALRLSTAESEAA